MREPPRLRATTAYDRTYDDPSPELLHRLLTEAVEEYPFVVLERLDLGPGGHFMQTFYWDDATGCSVEYREGSSERQFRTLVSGPLVPDGHRAVTGLLLDWAHERPGWRERHVWEPVFTEAQLRRERIADRTLGRLFRRRPRGRGEG
ncbi:hypothetical protein [Streptomyces cavernicola]|uniref:Uncharacterized protein n=1 Tax=Streptomyces cavernicola TaxID=3043613 RepID=A0ABT6SHW3_9ACTN|nr:hypothetical protein [Streptomyces sp. B-S-A6]MDI3407792.1 hypothetical protein [Streptomyces sp. B-S-A6]